MAIGSIWIESTVLHLGQQYEIALHVVWPIPPEASMSSILTLEMVCSHFGHFPVLIIVFSFLLAVDSLSTASRISEAATHIYFC